ncbi:MAG: hypothetical protein ACK5KL_18210 [Dysgonomonas sp.]
MNHPKKDMEFNIVQTLIDFFNQSQQLGKVKWWGSLTSVTVISTLLLLPLPFVITFIDLKFWLMIPLAIVWAIVVVFIVIKISDYAYNLSFNHLEIEKGKRFVRMKELHKRRFILFHNLLDKYCISHKKVLSESQLDKYTDLVKDDLDFSPNKTYSIVGVSIVFAFSLGLFPEVIKSLFPDNGWNIYLSFYILFIMVILWILWIFSIFRNKYIDYQNSRRTKLIHILKYLREIKENI